MIFFLFFPLFFEITSVWFCMRPSCILSLLLVFFLAYLIHSHILQESGQAKSHHSNKHSPNPSRLCNNYVFFFSLTSCISCVFSLHAVLTRGPDWWNSQELFITDSREKEKLRYWIIRLLKLMEVTRNSSLNFHWYSVCPGLISRTGWKC